MALAQQINNGVGIEYENNGPNLYKGSSGPVPTADSKAKQEWAQQTVADPKIQQRITDTEKSIEQLKADIKSLGDGAKSGSIADLNVALIEADKKLDDETTKAREQITKIEQTLAADTTVANVKEVVDKQTQVTDDINTAVDAITPLTPRLKEVATEIHSFTADHKLTLAEITKYLSDMRELATGLVTGQATSSQNTGVLIQRVNQLQEEAVKQARENKMQFERMNQIQSQSR